ncbi:antibiotic biosynthesis monooxygenase family protein [Euzebya rosea]|uniref:antibiotic biosynthesis monooxygenase family protein n=1 Tax=Euzebya rosea TaxID=2052804 RepID=UPI001300428E|nr:antibiotic biosynthesis monooxygenase family protein [Euzebya rosea]
MIRTVLRLDVRPGHANQLVEAFRSREILETSIAQDGCLSTEIAVSEDGLEAIVTATWDDMAAYGRWTSRSDRGSSAEYLNPHLSVPLDAATVGRIYRVAHRPVL